jgi:hypothetical protein
VTSFQNLILEEEKKPFEKSIMPSDMDENLDGMEWMGNDSSDDLSSKLLSSRIDDFG